MNAIKTEIKYPIAFDSKSNIIRADDPDIQIRRSAKTCCGCGEPMHYVHEFIRSGTHVTGHFRHTYNNPNCTVNKAIITGESIYHSDFKDLLYKKLKYHIDNKVQFSTEIHCECGEFHNHNIIKKVYRVEKEYYDEGFKPDIALITAENVVITVLEIIVTHRPENNYLDHLKNHNINLLTFELNINNNFQSWIDKYIGNDDVLHPSYTSWVRCDKLKLQYTFSLWSRWLDENSKIIQNTEYINALPCLINAGFITYDHSRTSIQPLQSFPLPKKGKSENIRIIQYDKSFAKIQIYRTEYMFLFQITQNIYNEMKEELRKNNINIDIDQDFNYLNGYIFSIIGIGGNNCYMSIRLDLMKEEKERLEQQLIIQKEKLEVLDQDLIRRREDKDQEILERDLITKTKEKEELNEELEKLHIEFKKLYRKEKELEQFEKKLIRKKEEKDKLEQEFMMIKEEKDKLEQEFMMIKEEKDKLEQELRNFQLLFSKTAAGNIVTKDIELISWQDAGKDSPRNYPY